MTDAERVAARAAAQEASPQDGARCRRGFIDAIEARHVPHPWSSPYTRGRLAARRWMRAAAAGANG